MIDINKNKNYNYHINIHCYLRATSNINTILDLTANAANGENNIISELAQV